MARLFVDLKLRLQRNVAESFGTVWLVPLAWVLGLLLGLAGFVLLASVRGLDPDAGGPFLVAGCTLVFASWLAGPLLAGAAGGDQLIDLHVIAPLPLSDRDRMVGLLAAASVGVMPTTTLLGLSGMAAGYGRSLFAAGVALLAALVLTAMCVVGSRATAALAGRLLRSSRRRYVQVALLALVALGLFLLMNAFRRSSDELLTLPASTLTGLLTVLPPGAVARAVVAGRDGAPLLALVLLAYGALATVGLGALWNVTLRHAMTTADAPPRSRRADVGPDRLALLRGVAGGPVTAVAAKEVRYVVREVRQLQQLVVGGVIALFTLVATLVGDDDVMKPFTPAILVFFLGAQTTTGLFAIDADATRGYALAGARWRDVLLGKQIALAVILAVPVAGLAVAAVVLGASAPDTVGGLFVAGALFSAFMAVGSLFSVRLAYPLPTDATAGNPMAAMVPSIGGMLVVIVLAVPLVGPAVATEWRWGSTVPGALAGLLLALALWRWAVRYADAWAGAHEPELLARLALR